MCLLGKFLETSTKIRNPDGLRISVINMCAKLRRAVLMHCSPAHDNPPFALISTPRRCQSKKESWLQPVMTMSSGDHRYLEPVFRRSKCEKAEIKAYGEVWENVCVVMLLMIYI